MQSNKKNIKTTCTEKEKPIVPIPADRVAEIVGCSESLVNKINREKRRSDTPTGEKVAKVIDLWAFGSNRVIEEIKKLVPIE